MLERIQEIEQAWAAGDLEVQLAKQASHFAVREKNLLQLVESAKQIAPQKELRGGAAGSPDRPPSSQEPPAKRAKPNPQESTLIGEALNGSGFDSLAIQKGKVPDKSTGARTPQTIAASEKIPSTGARPPARQASDSSMGLAPGEGVNSGAVKRDLTPVQQNPDQSLAIVNLPVIHTAGSS